MIRVALLAALAAALLAALLTACGGKGTAKPVERPSAPAARVDGYVLIWTDALIGHFDDVGRIAEPSGRTTGDVTVWKIVSDDGERLQVQNVRAADETSHCHGMAEELEDYELTVTVARADLAPVTPWEVVESFDDGTSVTLRAGVALGPPATDRMVTVDQLTLAMPIDDADAAWAYRPTAAYNEKEGESVGFLTETAIARFGGGRRIDGDVAFMIVYERTDGPHGALATLRTRCGEYKVLVDPKHLDEGGMGGLYGNMGEKIPDGWIAHAGTTVTWADGTIAGKVVNDTELFGQPTVIDARVCFRKRLHAADRPTDPPRADGALLLCFPTSAH